MKRFFVFVKKEFWHIFRDYRTMMILFLIPIAQVLIFGYVVSNEIKNAEIGILDKSKDEVTRELTSRILSSGYFQLSQNLHSESEIEPLFRKGKVKMVIVFPINFSESLERISESDIQIITDASDANIANVLANYSRGIIEGYVREKNNMNSQNNMTIVPQVRMFYNENLEGVFMSVPGIMAMILILISAMMTSISITREKEFGSMELLLISPLKPIQIILGKVTPYIVLAFANAVSVVSIGVFIFKMPMEGSYLLLMAECMLYIMLALSLGIFISTRAPNQMVAMFMSLFALMLPTILLSGFIFPLENMPAPLQVLGSILPPKWFVLLVKKIMLKGGGIAYVWKETLILFSMTLFFIAMSIKNFKIRVE